jgi:hypothetical protein
MHIAETRLILREFKAHFFHISVPNMWYESLLIYTHFIPDEDSQSKHAESFINTLFYSALCQYVTVSPYNSK